MPTSSVTYPIFAGSPASGTSSLILVDSGTTGDVSALRRLVHPDMVNFAPLVYASNPERTINFDTSPLLTPIVSVQRTMSSTRITRFEMLTEDVIVSEVWPAGGSRASMTAAFFRLIYEYLVNPPAFDPIVPVYVTWEPRDRTTNTFAVEMLRLQLGGGGDVDTYDVREIQSLGGAHNSGTYHAGLDGLDAVRTGVLDVEVKLTMRIVALVV